MYGGGDKIPAVTHIVKDGDQLALGHLKITALATPCHTTESISYLVHGEPDIIFTGDTLFTGPRSLLFSGLSFFFLILSLSSHTAGCGKFFEGTAEQMRRNMEEVFSPLKAETLVYPGHEYTVSNLKFAKSVDPHNQTIAEKLKWSQERRAAGQPTVPSTIAEEKLINPFIRLR